MGRIRSQLARLLALLAGGLPLLASAHGLGLPTVSFAAGGTGLTSFYVLGFELGPWQEYLAQELTPDYLRPDNVVPVRVSWLRNSDVHLLPDFANRLEADGNTHFYFRFEYQSSADYLTPDFEPEPAGIRRVAMA